MLYEFKIVDFQKEMKGYKNMPNLFGLRDTLSITIKNTGTNGWAKNKGLIKCIDEESDLIFDDVYLTEDVYSGDNVELILLFKRNYYNSCYGKCKCTLQLIYKDNEYNTQSFSFVKNFDVYGNPINETQNQVKEDKENNNTEINVF